MIEIARASISGRRRQKLPGQRSSLEAAFLFAARAHGLPAVEEEYRFAAEHVGGPGPGVRGRLAEAGLRDWRFDFAWPVAKVAVECEGGVFIRGRHTRGAGYSGDCAKYNAAAALGWTVIRVTGSMLTKDPHSICRHVNRLLGELAGSSC